MNRLSLMALPLIALAATGCVQSSGPANPDVTEIDLLANLEAPDFDNTSITDVKYTLLDTATTALLGNYCDIFGVMNDTVIIHDMTSFGVNSRLLLFDANDGHLIRPISHVGQGPGEYQWIQGVVTDPEHSELLLLANKALRYSTADRYIESYDSSNGKAPIGSAKNGIYQTQTSDGNLLIYRYDMTMTSTDTIVVKGFEPKWNSVTSNLSGDEVLINIADTVFSLTPGEMHPVAVLTRGAKALTPETDQKMLQLIAKSDMKQFSELYGQYIVFQQFINDYTRFIVTYTYGGRSYIDTYSRENGKLLARYSDSDDDNAGIPVPYADRTIHINRLPFYYNGRFYAIVSEEETLGNDGETSEDLNRALISWRVE
ncbi:6-bladed beta-propeller [Muribaculaceae bacterium Isolate-104 (HZI)]|nr:6-bladed beta-propeller [Muribaculaceae bacterium Isolate-104 (HZI)]